MAAKLFNRVKFSTSTTGTGDIAVGSAVSGFITPAVAGAANNDTVPYFIEDGANFAHGLGTYSTTGPTLVRDASEVSWNGSSLATANLSLSGSAKVMFTPRAVDRQPPGGVVLTPGGILTIASDAITVTDSYHTLETEGAASTDNLATINGGVEGQILVLRTNSASHDVTVKDGTGNIFLSADMVLDRAEDTLTLIKWSTIWVEIARSNNQA